MCDDESQAGAPELLAAATALNLRRGLEEEGQDHCNGAAACVAGGGGGGGAS